MSGPFILRGLINPWRNQGGDTNDTKRTNAISKTETKGGRAF